MSIVQRSSDKSKKQDWDWKADSGFLEQLRKDLRQQAMARLHSGTRAISVSSLVQESLVKLLKAKCLTFPEDRTYLYAFASRAMRNVIVDHVRARQTLKRGRKQTDTNIDLLIGAIESNNIDILAIHEALEVLAEKQNRQAQVVEMKFFAGCTMPEIAEHLGIGLSTVENDWKHAKEFLKHILMC